MPNLQILLCGCMGRMGHAVTQAAAQQLDAVIVAGVDAHPGDAPFPVYRTPGDCREPVNVIIDFSHPAALADELAYAVAHRLPLVLATTGLNDSQLAAVREAAQQIPVFSSGNMSLGVAVLAALTKKAAAVLGDSFDIEIVEMHHNQKLDAPSGTAMMLAEAARSGLRHPVQYIYDRHERRQKRSPEEIGIASVRGGNIVGEHQVIFAGGDEVVTLTHRAQSRGIFADGALHAARFLLTQPAGLYTMDNLLGQL